MAYPLAQPQASPGPKCTKDSARVLGWCLNIIDAMNDKHRDSDTTCRHDRAHVVYTEPGEFFGEAKRSFDDSAGKEPRGAFRRDRPKVGKPFCRHDCRDPRILRRRLKRYRRAERRADHDHRTAVELIDHSG